MVKETTTDANKAMGNTGMLMDQVTSVTLMTACGTDMVPTDGSKDRSTKETT